MPEMSVRHEIETDEETYWKRCVLDPEFNRALFVDSLKFLGWKVLDQKDDDAKFTRRVQVDPPVDSMPAAVKKVVGDKLSYVEEGIFDKKTGRYSFKIHPSTLADKTKVSGEMWCEKIGDKKIARHVKLSVEVKVFMVGGMIEERLIGDLQSSYGKGAAFTNAYVKENGL
jgi:hypothetical protein